MRATTHRSLHWLWALSLPLVLLLAACGPAKADATPTISVQQIYTAAFQTLAAQQATQLALTPPTSTPLPPTALPTLPPTSASPLATFAPIATIGGGGGGAGACDNSAFVSDVTIPDNTTITPGKSFVKTWQLLNNGTCTWSTSYKLAFDSGDQMGGTSASMTTAVAAGTVVNISVNLTAPTTNGTFKGTWRMQNAGGQAFGSLPYVQIKVGAGSTATAGPSPTAGAGQVTISGSFNVSEVTLDFTGADSTPTVSYSGNDYSFIVPKGWSGTIIPSKGNPGHWAFTPASKSFANVTNDKSQDFTAVPVTPTIEGTP